MLDLFFKKYFWSFNLLSIMACAYLVAGAGNKFVAQAIAPDLELPASVATEGKGKEKEEQWTKKAQYNPVTGEKMTPVIVEDVVAPDPTLGNLDTSDGFSENTPCSKTTLPLELLGTMASTTPEDSFAIIKTQDKKTTIVEPGIKITDAVVVGIFRHRVLFKRDGGRMECLVYGELPEAKKEEKKEVAEDGEGIRCTSDTECLIAQSEIDRAMANLNSLMTQAKMVPSYKNGKHQGFRIYSIKPKSLYQKLGLKNGDILQAINKMSLDSPEKGLEIYSKLKTEKNLSVDLVRRGRNMTMEYTIQ